MENLILTPFAQEIIDNAQLLANQERHEFLTPEHFILSLICHDRVREHNYEDKINFQKIWKEITALLKQYVPSIPDGIEYELMPSKLMKTVLKNAKRSIKGREDTPIPSVAVLISILNTAECPGAEIVMREIKNIQEIAEVMLSLDSKSIMRDDEYYDDIDSESKTNGWAKYVIDLKEKYAGKKHSIIGRDNEISRISQVLCRCDKNNALIVGDPGVGKSALIQGFVNRSNDLPRRIKQLPVYEISVQSLISGAQYHGELEQRVGHIMNGLKDSGGAIIVIDDMHTLAGSKGDANGARDLTQLFMPYLDDEDLRFIGITNHEDITRYMDSCTRFLRRFQQIDINEPSIDETIKILNSVKKRYEKHHNVKYDSGTAERATKLSVRFLSSRNLPDKAIDVLDEAGAFREMNPQTERKRQTVDNNLIDSIVAQMGNIATKIIDENDTGMLRSLGDNLRKLIFGQDEAIDSVVESVLSARAGLTDAHKPQASLLFVGPTGVGKTEVAHVLAEQLGLTLHKFDMSEYSESYSVSKLIGSSPGYVGYEEGGRLTEAVRKNPHCVLLLDEIEKAHEKIFDTLLQVMDYASLTDSRGRKVDFSNVILIMTSNSGAQYAKQAGLGFGSSVTTGQAMLSEVKKTFKPEFINRLSNIVVFNDMSEEMASLILDKKLQELNTLLAERNVTLSVNDDARQWLLKEGFSSKYGAREIERVISRQVKPLLVKELLFGKLSKKGTAILTTENGLLKLIAEK